MPYIIIWRYTCITSWWYKRDICELDLMIVIVIQYISYLYILLWQEEILFICNIVQCKLSIRVVNLLAVADLVKVIL